MTEAATPETDAVREPVHAATAGGMLREAREGMHVDIAVLASILKVPEHKLLALEADQFDQLPDMTFARALAASVCRTLQIDPAPVLARFPKPAHAAQRGSGPINAPYRTQSESSVTARAGSALQSRYMWLVLAILLGAVVLAMLPNLDKLRWSTGDSAPGPVATASEAVPALVPAASASAQGPVLGALPAASEALAAVAPASAPAAPASAAHAGPVLRLVASKGSWVQVRDVTGKTLISRTLAAGEDVGLDGQGPFKLIVGNTDGLALTVRGQAFDFATVTKSTTARFELQ